MSTDFFDGLVKTFSKTTRELGKTTRELGARAEQTIETQKIRNKIAGEERIIEKIKVDMGDIIYRRHEAGDGIDSELSSLCQEIDQHLLKIREFKDNAANLKGQKISPSCEREVDMSVSFCPYCGTPCPTPEPAENVEGEAVQAEEETKTEDTADVQEKAADGSNGSEEEKNGEPKTESAESEENAEDTVEKEAVEEIAKEEIEETEIVEESEGESEEK